MGARRLLIGYFALALTTMVTSAAAAQRADAILLVNSHSASYADAQTFIRPYLDNFGVPYTVLDIATTAVPSTIGDYALIIIGHRQLDVGPTFYLSPAEQGFITLAVQNGSGLVNFDRDLSADNVTARYSFVQSLFGFGYVAPSSATGATFPADAENYYVTSLHEGGEATTTMTMTVAGITLPGAARALVSTTSPARPFLVSVSPQNGRAIQWTTYDWMSTDVKGPMYGLDDLVWRSLVWAARKPFTMQGLPNILTMRVDDAIGSFWYVDTVNRFGLKPWLGIFSQHISDPDSADLSSLVHAGNATASVHAEYNDHWFYWDHDNLQNWPDPTMNSKFDAATAWHTQHDIPISKFALGHYYEMGTNVFARLAGWGVEFVGTHMSPGGGYDTARWIQEKPYRQNVAQSFANRALPVYYADFLAVPGHPEFQNTFFNCVTEIRDDAGYEWYPDNDVAGTIGRGTRQLKRAFDSMALGTLFTHEQYIVPITPANWSQEIQGIMANVAAYAPRSMTMDDACRYIRAVYKSDIASSQYDPATRNLSATMTGSADVATQFYVFTERNGSVVGTLVNVPTFSGSSVVVQKLPGTLHHVVVSPDPGRTPVGGYRQFTAQGFDVDEIAIPGLTFAWSLAAGGSIDATGTVAAAASPGTYTNAVAAAAESVTGNASLVVYTPVLDHFVFDTIAQPVYADTAFPVTIRAIDQFGAAFPNFNGAVALTDTTGTVFPRTAQAFTFGVFTGSITLDVVAGGVTLTATAGSASGLSAAFDVVAPASGQITFNCWEDRHQNPKLPTTTNAALLNPTSGSWAEFWYVCCRPFPTVMAASGETALGLPVMRYFDVGVQNGTYQVYANLYTNNPGRNMRYYFGYLPQAPKASYVDVLGADGDTYQHHEYYLGTADVDDGTFSIYVQDADLLAGSYPFFGWADVRLVQTCAATKWYADADLDGYGDPANRRFSCSAPAGFVASASDCDDGNPAVHPGAADSNCNAIDENCNGVLDDGGAAACDDQNPCTTDACTNGACIYTNTCTSCLSAVEGAPCSDGNSCTLGDHCVGGSCHGGAAATPGEIGGVVMPGDKVTMSWTPASGSGVLYDVVRGSLGGLPVGSQSDGAVCLANSVSATSVDVSGAPPVGSGFWYLVRGARPCAFGSYGFDKPASGAPAQRITNACP